jgi:hypothetical protein
MRSHPAHHSLPLVLPVFATGVIVPHAMVPRLEPLDFVGTFETSATRQPTARGCTAVTRWPHCGDVTTRKELQTVAFWLLGEQRQQGFDRALFQPTVLMELGKGLSNMVVLVACLRLNENSRRGVIRVIFATVGVSSMQLNFVPKFAAEVSGLPNQQRLFRPGPFTNCSIPGGRDADG